MVSPFSPTPTIIDFGQEAWVETVANGGNNSSAVIGRPDRPFATIQAAVAAGAKHVNLGIGAHTGGAWVNTNGMLTVLGKGRDLTTVAAITGNGGTSFYIHDIGHKSVFFTSFTSEAGTGADGAEDMPGEAGPSADAVNLQGVCIGTILLQSGNGGNGGPLNLEAGTNGGNSGDPSDFQLRDCEVGNIKCIGGAGGNAVGAGTGGFGREGSSFNVIERTIIAGDVWLIAGNGGEAPDPGGVGGNGGTGGTITTDYSKLGYNGFPTLVDGGNGGAGGSVSGDNGSQGQLNAMFCIISSIPNSPGGQRIACIIGGGFDDIDP